MARELSDPPTRTSRRVDWARYDTGKVWELVQGVDFDQTPKAAGKTARGWARNHGRRATIRTFPDRITLYIHPRTGGKN